MSDLEGESYDVERIVAARVASRRGRKVKWLYQVRWKDYSPEDDTEEPAEHFNTPRFVAEFWNNVDTQGKDRNNFLDWSNGDRVFPRNFSPSGKSLLVDAADTQTTLRRSAELDDTTEEFAPEKLQSARIGPPKRKQTSTTLSAPSTSRAPPSPPKATYRPASRGPTYRKRKRQSVSRPSSRSSSPESIDFDNIPKPRPTSQSGPPKKLRRLDSDYGHDSESQTPQVELTRLTHQKPATPPTQPVHQMPPRTRRPKTPRNLSAGELALDEQDPGDTSSEELELQARAKKHALENDVEEVPAQQLVEYSVPIGGLDDEEETTSRHSRRGRSSTPRRKVSQNQASTSSARGRSRSTSKAPSTPKPRTVSTTRRASSKKRGQVPKVYASIATQTSGCMCDRCLAAAEPPDAIVEPAPTISFPPEKLPDEADEMSFDVEPAAILDDRRASSPIEEVVPAAVTTPKVGPPSRKRGRPSKKPSLPSEAAPPSRRGRSASQKRTAQAGENKESASHGHRLHPIELPSTGKSTLQLQEGDTVSVGLSNVSKLFGSELPKRMDWSKLRPYDIDDDVDTPEKVFLEVVHPNWRDGTELQVDHALIKRALEVCWKTALPDEDVDLMSGSDVETVPPPKPSRIGPPRKAPVKPRSNVTSSMGRKASLKKSQSKKPSASADPSRDDKEPSPSPLIAASQKPKPRKIGRAERSSSTTKAKAKATAVVPMPSDDRGNRRVGRSNVHEVLRDFPHGLVNWDQLRADYDIPSDIDTEEHLFLDFINPSWRVGEMYDLSPNSEREARKFISSYFDKVPSDSEADVVLESEEEDVARKELVSPSRSLPQPSVNSQPVEEEEDVLFMSPTTPTPNAPLESPIKVSQTLPRPHAPSHHERAAHPQVKLLNYSRSVKATPGITTKTRVASGATAASSLPAKSPKASHEAAPGAVVSTSPNGTPHRQFLASGGNGAVPKSVPVKQLPSQAKFKPRSSLLTFEKGALMTIKGSFKAPSTNKIPSLLAGSSSLSTPAIEQSTSRDGDVSVPPSAAIGNDELPGSNSLLASELRPKGPVAEQAGGIKATATMATLGIETTLATHSLKTPDPVTPITPGDVESPSISRMQRPGLPGFGSSKKPSTIFDSGGFLSAKTAMSAGSGSGQSAFELRLSNSVAVPVVLKDPSDANGTSATALVEAVTGPTSLSSGKFYQAQYAEGLLNAFKMSGESARVLFDESAGDKMREQWGRFVGRLSSGEIFVAPTVTSTLVLCSSENVAVGQRLGVKSNLLGVKDSIVVAHVTIEDVGKFTDIALNAGS